MHITQRAIIGYDVPDTHPMMVNLDWMQRVLVRTQMQGELKYRKGQYTYKPWRRSGEMGVSLPPTNLGKLKQYL